MPRVARKKSEEAIYHVMSRSISEVDLFLCDEDKDHYLALLKRYKEKFYCKVYGYILMSNHVHIFINPCGADISSFMLCLNTAYVAYFNKKYDRHGHLFQGRFASTIVDNDTYALKLSAYIHNNAKDLPGYTDKEESYRYSSYGVYTGYRKDVDEIVDTEFILGLLSQDKRRAQQKYRAFVESMKGVSIIEEVGENIAEAYTSNEYRGEKSYVVRSRAPGEIVQMIERMLGEKIIEKLRAKYRRETSQIRAFVTYILRVLCGYTYKMICKYIGNMSMSGISRLTNEGFRLLKEQIIYQNVFNSLIQVQG
ncbi:MAG TPA: transposase [Clostridiaceae bacterium]|nr:transposase [Clostridiaceae bacterium]